MRENGSFLAVKFYCFLVVISLFLSVSNVHAGAELTLTPQLAPDLGLWEIDVAYNASTHTFNAAGPYSGQTFTDAEENMYIFDDWGVFNLSATVDNAGVISAGLFSLTGSVLGYGTTGPLLTGNNPSILQSDFETTQSPGNDVAFFEFLFDVSGGDMANLFGGIGNQVVISMYFVDAPNIAETQFTANFDNLRGNPFGEGTGNTMGDIQPLNPVPEPATMLLLGIGGLFLGKRKK